jgi:hypothetical protein
MLPIQKLNWKFVVSRKQKVFCIGLNKTGTSSLEKEMKLLGFKVDNYKEAHKLMYAYENRDFNKIVEHCKGAEFFQDSPFSMKYTFYFLYNTYPDAKYILTTRGSAEEWYESIVRFHSKTHGTNGKKPTLEELKAAKRPHGRTIYDNLKMRFNTPDTDIYNKEILMEYYDSHNKDVIDFFRLKPKNFLILNLAEKDSYSRFCEFLQINSERDGFPHLNKSK